MRVTDYGPGRIRPHERTHPGPKEDRLRLTRATRANLSPIFSLFSDPSGGRGRAIEPATRGAPYGETPQDDGTVDRLWRIADPAVAEAVTGALADAELLIADGHHRYETARVYAQEAGTEGAGWVLMCLVALEDPGLTVFPTHRLVRGRGLERYEALAGVLREHFAIEEVGEDDLAPPPSDGPMQLGYVDSHFKRPFRLTLRGEPDTGLDGPLACAPRRRRARGAAPQGRARAQRRRHQPPARLRLRPRPPAGIELVTSGEYDVAFLMRPTPVDQVREVAAAGPRCPRSPPTSSRRSRLDWSSSVGLKRGIVLP